MQGIDYSQLDVPAVVLGGAAPPSRRLANSGVDRYDIPAFCGNRRTKGEGPHSVWGAHMAMRVSGVSLKGGALPVGAPVCG